MLVPLSNAVKVESVPLKSNFCGTISAMGPPPDSAQRLAPPPRRVPGMFWLAELLPFRWRYLWTLLVVALAPAALWIRLPAAFAAAAVLTLAGIYAVQLRGTRIRTGLLRHGRVATVTGSEKLSRTGSFTGTTRYNVRLPVAHGWTVTRQRWTGPSTRTAVRYELDGRPGELVVRGREYVDGVILADQRDPARARCVSSFAYDLDRDDNGDWVGRLRRRVVGLMVLLVLFV